MSSAHVKILPIFWFRDQEVRMIHTYVEMVCFITRDSKKGVIRWWRISRSLRLMDESPPSGKLVHDLFILQVCWVSRFLARYNTSSVTEKSSTDANPVSCNSQISYHTPFAGQISNYSELSRRIKDKFNYFLGTATERNDIFFASIC